MSEVPMKVEEVIALLKNSNTPSVLQVKPLKENETAKQIEKRILDGWLLPMWQDAFKKKFKKAPEVSVIYSTLADIYIIKPKNKVAEILIQLYNLQQPHLRK